MTSLCSSVRCRCAGVLLLFQGCFGVFSSDTTSLSTAATNAAGRQVIQGVVCFYNSPANELFVLESTNGVLVRPGQQSHLDLGPGQLLEIEGHFPSGGNSRGMIADSIRLLGEGPLPSPIPANYYGMSSGQLNCCYCQISAVVRAVRGPRSDGLLSLELMMQHGGPVTCLIKDYHFADCRRLIDAEVRISGICLTEPDPAGGRVRITLRVSGMGGIDITRPAPEEPFVTHAAAADIFLHPGFTSVHRVKLSGIVWFQQPGTCLYLLSGLRVVRVETTQPTLVSPGDLVELLGFPSVKDGHELVLEDSEFRRVATGTKPAVFNATTETLRNGNHYGHLVQLESVIVDSSITGEMRVRSGTMTFPIHLIQASKAGPVGFHRGNRIRITGVPVPNTASLSQIAPGFEMWVRSPADLTALPRFGWGAGITLLLFGASAGLVVTLLRRSQSLKASAPKYSDTAPGCHDPAKR